MSACLQDDASCCSPLLVIGQQPADQLPWFHVVTLLTKIKEPDTREWYAWQTVEKRWSRSTLQQQIKSQLHLRQGAALTNFEERLTTQQHALAQQMLKDPYHFDFLGLGVVGRQQSQK